MASIGFGDGVARRQWYLPGIDETLLPRPPANGLPPVAGAIEATEADPVAGTALFDGRVTVTAAPIGGAAGLVFTTADVANAVLLGMDGAAARFIGFDHVDAQLGGAAPGVLELLGVQRANLITGAGADRIRIDTLRSDPLTGQGYRVVTGEGDDAVRIGAAALAGDTSGFGMRSQVLLGAGNDTFVGRNLTADEVDGGTGRDEIWGGPGNDSLKGGAGPDIFVFLPGDGDDRVRDFYDPSGAGPVTTTLFFGASATTPNVTPVDGGIRYIPDDDYGAPGLDWSGWIIGPAVGGFGRAIQPISGAPAALSADRPFTLHGFDAEQTSPVGTENTYILTGFRGGVAVASRVFSITAVSEAITLDAGFRRIDMATLRILGPTGFPDGFFIDNLRITTNDGNPAAEDRLRFPLMSEAEALAMLAAAVQDGADTVFDTGDGTVRLLNTQAASIGLDDLILG